MQIRKSTPALVAESTPARCHVSNATSYGRNALVSATLQPIANEQS